VTTYKGTVNYPRGLTIEPIDGMDKLPDTSAGKQWIFFLKAKEDGVGVPQFYPAAQRGWFMSYTPAIGDKVRKAIPLPEAWGKEVGGLRLGVRLRKTKVELGQDVIADIYLENVSQKGIQVQQHRYNIYDYWPRTRFEVISPDGKTHILEKPSGPVDEADWPNKWVLQPGATYSHAVYLNRWPVTTGQIQNRAANVFVEPGEYTLT
jgi:hypothetical protein